MQAPDRIARVADYSGDKGFSLLSTVRLVATLSDYKRLRSSARDPATAAHARQAIRELRAELGRRQGDDRAAA